MVTYRQARLENVDALRGVAAMAVAWFHFTHGNPGFLADGALKFSGAWGWLGVEVFFVISGFVLPLALHAAGYRISGFGRFLVKRLVRLEPPYLVSIALVLGLGWLSSQAPGFAGNPWVFNGPQVASHIGYLAGALGYDWLNPVYWTLAIELQFYLLVGLTYGLIINRHSALRWATLLAWLTLSVLVPSGLLVMHLLGFFSLGLVTVWLRIGMITRFPYIVTSLLIAAVVLFEQGLAPAVVGLGSAWAIAWLRFERIPGLCWLGAVSYSLYLLHVPIGGRVINIGARVAESSGSQALVLAIAVTLSLSCAWLMYCFIERPAMRWASNVRYFSVRRVSESVQ